MPNYLKMPKKAQVLALLELGWSYRRIEAETGVRRETVSGYDAARQANPAKTFPGSDPSPQPDSLDVPLETGQIGQNVAGSVKPGQNVPRLAPAAPRFAAAVYRTAISRTRVVLTCTDLAGPGRRSTGTARATNRWKRFCADDGRRRREPSVSFTAHPAPRHKWISSAARRRSTPPRASGDGLGVSDDAGHSRHGYEEAVWDQKLETFLRLHERPSASLGGVPMVCTSRQSQKRPSCARVFFDPIAMMSTWRSPRTGASPRCRRARAIRRKNGKQERSGGTSKPMR